MVMNCWNSSTSAFSSVAVCIQVGASYSVTAKVLCCDGTAVRSAGLACQVALVAGAARLLWVG